jgi:hypothetical protein
MLHLKLEYYKAERKRSQERIKTQQAQQKHVDFSDADDEALAVPAKKA